MLATSTRLTALLTTLALGAMTVTRAAGDSVPAATTDSSATGPALFDTDRPDLTDAAARIEPGVFQIETGWSRTAQDLLVQTSFGDALVRIGVSSAFELRVFTPGRERVSVRGFSNEGWGEIGAGFKLGHTSADGDRAFGLVASIATPVQSYGTGFTETAAALAGDWNSANLGTSVNLGVHRVSSGGFANDDVFASTSVSDEITRRLSMFLEIAADFVDRDELDWSLFADTGASWALVRHLQLDASVGRSFDAAGAWTIGAGLSKRW